MPSSYPIFLNLLQKKVLVVGAGKVAERKIQNLLAAGADVYIIAREVDDHIQQQIDQKNIHFLGREFVDESLSEFFLVIAATNNHQLNARIYKTANSQQKLVNVVDSPQFCNFTLPAVVERLPVQVAIGTQGTSPVLARKIKEQLELKLPSYLGSMASLLNQYRERVKQKIIDPIGRRKFWENLITNNKLIGLLNTQQVNKADHYLQQLIEQPSELEQTGIVSLVGAGPGDAGLLTLKGFQTIQQADVVLYDALVPLEILKLIRKDAEKIYVGKRAKNHHVVQENINQLLIDYAKKGLRVARLKGGDPFIFGRGGEEIAILKQQKIAYQVIPGITAAIGAAAYAGIPLTHREFAQTLILITGHLAKTQTKLNWEFLAAPHQSLAIYMGILQAKIVAEQLMLHGKEVDTPVAIISRGTLIEQQTLLGKLHELAELAKLAVRPSIILIGEVVKFHTELSWFSEKST